MREKGPAGDRPATVKPVNRYVDLLARVLHSLTLSPLFRLRAVNAAVVPIRGPAIIVANHVNLFDPIWIYKMAGRPVHFAATEDLFRNRWVAGFARLFGAFPKRKGANDLIAVRSIVGVIRQGGIVGIYPEGVRTWDGSNTEVLPAIARLIKMVRVPVLVCRLEGAYFAYPRWARRRRKVPVRGYFSLLYDVDAIPRRPATIVADIEKAIRTRDYELGIDERRYCRSRMAEDLPRLLYRCPNCGKFESLEVCRNGGGNVVRCARCRSAWRVSVGCRLYPAAGSGDSRLVGRPLPEVYGRIRGMPLAVERNTELALKEGESLYLSSREQRLFVERSFPRFGFLGVGRLFLTGRRLVFQVGDRSVLEAPLSDVDSHSVDPGDKLHFVYLKKLYRIPFVRESALKWYDTIIRLTVSTTRGKQSEGGTG